MSFFPSKQEMRKEGFAIVFDVPPWFAKLLMFESALAAAIVEHPKFFSITIIDLHDHAILTNPIVEVPLHEPKSCVCTCEECF